MYANGESGSHVRQAAILWAAADALRDDIGVALRPHEQAAAVAKARAALNDENAWAEGAALPWEEAVKLALGE